tara:strand:+ start:2123 stop:2833 length:711 start_codon:yes stop_codon:yes gene_type:complete
MRFNWGKILLALSLIFSIGVLYASNLKNNSRIINKIHVEIIPNSSYFITADSIQNSINKYILTSKDSISLSKIEQEIDKNTYVEKSQVYMKIGQELNVDIKQKEPVARVITADSIFYLDKNSNFMSLSKLKSSNVPLIFGFSEYSDLKYLTEISLMIKNDEFLNKNISQIFIKDDQKIDLKMRGNSTIIEFGNNKRLKNKIQNLKAFYNRAISKNEIDKYKEINLQFENQVVVVKK